MKPKETSPLKYEVRHVAFHELDDLEVRHPLVSQIQSRISFEHLKKCPGMTDDFPVCFYIVIENKIASSFMTFPDMLFIGSREYPWAWNHATYTNPSYRGRGLATALNREAIKVLHQNGWARSAAFSSAATVHIYNKLGLTFPGYVKRYLMLKSLRPILKAHFPSQSLAGFFDFLSRPFLFLMNHIIYGRKRRDDPKMKMERISLENEKALIESFPKVVHEHPFHFDSSPSKLRWKINVSNSLDDQNCSLYMLKDAQQNHALCYFIIRTKFQREPRGSRYKDFKLMTLMDFGLFRYDLHIYSVLLKKVLNLFWASDAEIFEIVSNSNTMNSLIKKYGMLKAGRGVSFNFIVPKEWNWENEWDNLENWNITHFSVDAFSL
jgi:GNAT superfamily N-acetyltransferase